MLFTEIQMTKDVYEKPINKSIFKYEGYIIRNFKSRQYGGIEIVKVLTGMLL